MRAPEELDTIVQTLEHIGNVRRMMTAVAMQLVQRGEDHDASKLGTEELPLFVKFTPKLKNSVYNSAEYKEYLAEMQPALVHHYAVSRHHPELYPSGVDDMTLIDLIELLIDWKAATLRHATGDIRKSIEINKERFGLSDQLVKILFNTLNALEVEPRSL
jgi:hypothetical protein